MNLSSPDVQPARRGTEGRLSRLSVRSTRNKFRVGGVIFSFDFDVINLFKLSYAVPSDDAYAAILYVKRVICI